jgi:hypothetical protein
MRQVKELVALEERYETDDTELWLEQAESYAKEMERYQKEIQELKDRRAELVQSLGIINTKSGMHFKADLFYAVLCAELCFFLPVRNENVVPLIFKNREIILGPRASNPVGIFGIFAIAGATGKSDDFPLLLKINLCRRRKGKISLRPKGRKK